MRISDWSSDVCSSDLEADRKRARAILDDERQIAMPGEVMGETITNFWRDAANPRGIWRQSPLDAYLAGKPVWTTLIDVDALGQAEKQSWVWHGADCLAPDYRSEERRVGKECVSTCRSRWSP